MRKTTSTITEPSISLVPALQPLGSQESGLKSMALPEIRSLAVIKAKKEGIPTTAIQQGTDGWNKAKLVAFLESSITTDQLQDESDQHHDIDKHPIVTNIPAPEVAQATSTELGEDVAIITIAEFPEGKDENDLNRLDAAIWLEKTVENKLVEQKVDSKVLLPNVFNIRDLPLPNKISDMRLAEFFSKACQDGLRFWSERKKWLVYDQKCWNPEAPGGAFPLFKEILKLLYTNISEIEVDDKRIELLKQLLHFEGHKRQEVLLSAAAVIPEINIASSQLDQNSMLLNCLNGTLNLKTGKLQQQKPEDLITKLVSINYSADAECPDFLRFLDRIMDSKPELINYIQRYVGYCLTGNISEQILTFFYGTGANGKTTLANVIAMLLGDFASTAGSTLLMRRDKNSSTNDLAALRGARVVIVSEFDDGEILAEATVKSLTGGDRIACRYLYGEFFEYTPQYKILLLGNYKPTIRGRDHGIWRRIHLIPFKITIPANERDPKLMEKFTAELPGILAWAVKGCLEWQKIGLCPPHEVKEEVKAYRQSEDIFKQWIDDCCIKGDEHCTSSSNLYQSFTDYSNRIDITVQKLGHMLAEAGFQKEKKGTISWLGIGLKD